jgi:hypothetical protein
MFDLLERAVEAQSLAGLNPLVLVAEKLVR